MIVEAVTLLSLLKPPMLLVTALKSLSLPTIQFIPTDQLPPEALEIVEHAGWTLREGKAIHIKDSTVWYFPIE
jgi:hypothetical protein